MKPVFAACIVFLAYSTFAQASFAAASADQICGNVLLTRQEQDLCRQQMAAAQTMEELKQIQTKFRDRIKAAEEAKKAKK